MHPASATPSPTNWAYSPDTLPAAAQTFTARNTANSLSPPAPHSSHSDLLRTQFSRCPIHRHFPGLAIQASSPLNLIRRLLRSAPKSRSCHENRGAGSSIPSGVAGHPRATPPALLNATIFTACAGTDSATSISRITTGPQAIQRIIPFFMSPPTAKKNPDHCAACKQPLESQLTDSRRLHSFTISLLHSFTASLLNLFTPSLLHSSLASAITLSPWPFAFTPPPPARASSATSAPRHTRIPSKSIPCPPSPPFPP